jgi:hypothetical protein
VARLQIALQDGFDADAVVVSVDGTEVFRKDGVTTRRQIGLADTFEVDVPERPAQLEVAVPSRGVSEAVPVDVREQPVVTLSLREGRIEPSFPDRLRFV